jgi:endo-1,4-beta-xylanase
VFNLSQRLQAVKQLFNLQRRDVILSGVAAAVAAASPVAWAAKPKAKASAAVASAAKAGELMGALEVPSLADAYKDIFPIGAAISPGQIILGGSTLIKHHYSVVVAENAMKPSELASKTQEGVYNFEAADEMVDWCLANNIKVRGHTLLWHNQYPNWMFNGKDGQPVERDVLIGRIERYITDVVTHFKGRVYAWDVVNEAFVFGESVKQDENGMRLSEYRTVIGPEYIEIAFRAAAKADPDAQLFYNDYETQNPNKVEAMVNMVKDFKTRGVKIDGIGHQAHYGMVHPNLDQLESAILAIAETGVTQHVTELDVALNNSVVENKITEEDATPELYAAHGKRYKAFFDLFVKHKKLVTAVLVWGVDDNGTWLRGWPIRRFEAPLLFNTEQKAKPAFWGVLEAAKSAGKST